MYCRRASFAATQPGRPAQSMPPESYTYAIPKDLAAKHGIRKYGFHGTSYKFVLQVPPPRPARRARASSGPPSHPRARPFVLQVPPPRPAPGRPVRGTGIRGAPSRCGRGRGCSAAGRAPRRRPGRSGRPLTVY